MAGRRNRDRSYVAGDHFFLRTPLLPYDEFEAWCEASTSRESSRAHLWRIYQRPEVRDALYVASPSLFRSLERWQEHPETERGQRIERALVKYFTRMTCRPTPFGLFAGVSVGLAGEETSLVLSEQQHYERNTRLDNDYLFELTETLAAAPAIRADLVYWPNSSMYRSDDRLRYAEAKISGTLRSYELIGAVADAYLLAAVERARTGARPEELARALLDHDPEIELSDASEFVNELIDAQILVSDLTPAVTGEEPLHGILQLLTRCRAAQASREVLARTRDQLEELDRNGLGATPDEYDGIERELAALPVTPNRARLFQVDLIKPAADARLGRRVVESLELAADVLRRLATETDDGPLAHFHASFLQRYDRREVPLVEALDEERGIGFATNAMRLVAASPLLKGLRFPAPHADGDTRWYARHTHLLSLLHDAVQQGERQVLLTDADITALGSSSPRALPDTFAIIASLIANGRDSRTYDDIELAIVGAGAQATARLMGRFCHASAEIRAAVEAQIRDEEALRPDAAFAEIVHLSDGRVGNILCRPVLRHYEIPYLGASGAPRDRRLPITDLLLSSDGERLRLRSETLDMEVLPRLSTAHNYTQGLGTYHFLCALQNQGQPHLAWTWGPLASAPFLPRVRYRNIILALAEWKLRREEVEELGAAPTPSALRKLRERCQLPRRLSLVDGDNEFPFDFDNPLSVAAFLDLAKHRPSVRLRELHDTDGLVCTSTDGRFRHELLASFTRSSVPRPTPIERRERGIHRSIHPNGHWLFLKFYCGAFAADDVLLAVGAAAEAAVQSKLVDRWFFVRYSDPDSHLRVRAHGNPTALRETVLPLLLGAADRLTESGAVWRIQQDSYEREIERYGGEQGTALAEELFWHDSRAALQVIANLDADKADVDRWQMAVLGTDRWLASFGLDTNEKLALIASLRDGFATEFNANAELKRQLGQTYREYRTLLVETLEQGESIFPAFADRSRSARPIIAKLDELRSHDVLSRSREDIMASLVHMYLNRVLRAPSRPQELVVCDLLRRYYAMLSARTR